MSVELKTGIFAPEMWRRIMRHFDEFEAANFDQLFGGVDTEYTWQELVTFVPDASTWIHAVKHRQIGVMMYLQKYAVPLQDSVDEKDSVLHSLIQWATNHNYLEIVWFLTDSSLPIVDKDDRVLPWITKPPQLSVAAIRGYISMIELIWHRYGCRLPERFFEQPQQVLSKVMSGGLFNTMKLLVPRLLLIQDLSGIKALISHTSIKTKNISLQTSQAMIRYAMMHLDRRLLTPMTFDDLASLHEQPWISIPQQKQWVIDLLITATKAGSVAIWEEVWQGIVAMTLPGGDIDQKPVIPCTREMFQCAFEFGHCEMVQWIWNRQRSKQVPCTMPSNELIWRACEALHFQVLYLLPANMILPDVRKCWQLVMQGSRNVKSDSVQDVVNLLQWLHQKNPSAIRFDQGLLREAIRTGQSQILNYVFELGEYTPEMINHDCRFLLIQHHLHESVEFFMELDIKFEDPIYLLTAATSCDVKMLSLLLKQGSKDYSWPLSVLDEAYSETMFCMSSEDRNKCIEMLQTAKSRYLLS